ncbi:MAG: RHS repeat-associated core domain-containing protein [Actinomycetota bacterium]
MQSACRSGPTATYESFGASRTTTKINPLAPDNPMRYTGQYLDPTGFYHLRARQYDPGLGRFSTTDPVAPALANPAVSWYAYVGNRPTVFLDPSGQIAIVAIPAGIGLAKIIAGAIGVAVGGAVVADAIHRASRSTDDELQQRINARTQIQGRGPEEYIDPSRVPPGCPPGMTRALCRAIAGTIALATLYGALGIVAPEKMHMMPAYLPQPPLVTTQGPQ